MTDYTRRRFAGVAGVAAIGTAIPLRYANPETSELTYTVQRGSQTHDISLGPK